MNSERSHFVMMKGLADGAGGQVGAHTWKFLPSFFQNDPVLIAPGPIGWAAVGYMFSAGVSRQRSAEAAGLEGQTVYGHLEMEGQNNLLESGEAQVLTSGP